MTDSPDSDELVELHGQWLPRWQVRAILADEATEAEQRAEIEGVRRWAIDMIDAIREALPTVSVEEREALHLDSTLASFEHVLGRLDAKLAQLDAK